MRVLVAAVARNGVIGRDGDLPWHIPEDLRRFKEMTMGGTLVMGRKTYESIGRPLPGRTTVVVTRQPDWSAPGVEVASSLESALEVAGSDDVFVVGGAEIYRQVLERGLVDVLELTEIDADHEGDTFFPPLDPSWRCTRREVRDGFTFSRYEKHL
ncbi:MAG TPA: dihydrofolate reductase [Acidimicrobiia bacterium]|nr:dihydrofolate reductase [Acidimicrobiia bacterium]